MLNITSFLDLNVMYHCSRQCWLIIFSFFLTEQQNKPVDVVNHVQLIPEAIPEETDKKATEEKNNSASNSDSDESNKNVAPCENGLSSDIPHMEQKAEHNSNNSNVKRKDKHKRTINGLIKSVRSPETVAKDPEDTKGLCPEPKKIKVEPDSAMQDAEVEQIMSDTTLATTPNQPPQTQGTPTAMETVSNSSSEETKPDLANDSAASTSAQCSDDNEKDKMPVENSTRRDSNGKSPEHDKKEKDCKQEKKNAEQHHRKHKKRKEKKKHRHPSGNDSTGSDAPGSPMYNQSSGVFSSPRRPRMSFDTDLGKTGKEKKKIKNLIL